MLKLCVIIGTLALLKNNTLTCNLDAENFMCVLFHYKKIR